MEKEFSDMHFKIGKPSKVFLPQSWYLRSEDLARFSDLKVSIRELS